MTKAAFAKINGALVPMDADGREFMAALIEGKRVMVSVHVARNVRHHRLLFGLMKMLTDGGAWQGNAEDLLDYLKIAARLVKTVVGADGQVYHVPQSIAFESMDQVAFNRFFERAVYVVCERLLPAQNWEALRDEIIEAVDGDVARRFTDAADLGRAA